MARDFVVPCRDLDCDHRSCMFYRDGYDDGFADGCASVDDS